MESMDGHERRRNPEHRPFARVLDTRAPGSSNQPALLVRIESLNSLLASSGRRLTQPELFPRRPDKPKNGVPNIGGGLTIGVERKRKLERK